jgi:four helix bundle protein
MRRLFPVILDWIATLPPVIASIDRHDRSLADQLRRSSTSVGLNVAEGMAAVGRAKTNCYRIALREMREAVAAIEIAIRLAYVTAIDGDDLDRQGRIIGTLVRLAIPKK